MHLPIATELRQKQLEEELEASQIAESDAQRQVSILSNDIRILRDLLHKNRRKCDELFKENVSYRRERVAFLEELVHLQRQVIALSHESSDQPAPLSPAAPAES